MDVFVELSNCQNMSHHCKTFGNKLDIHRNRFHSPNIEYLWESILIGSFFCNRTRDRILEELSKYNFYSNDNKFRKLVIRIITNRFFDIIILIFILINSIFLGLTDYDCLDYETKFPSHIGFDPETGLDKKSIRNEIMDSTELPFTIIFTIEAVLKIIGMGFIYGEGAYLHDGWNWIDFIVVLTSILGFIPELKTFAVFHVFRLLRPLRTLNRLPSMKGLVIALLSSLPGLLNVLILLLFIFSIFGIVALQFFQGRIHQRCRLTEYPISVNRSLYDEYSDLELEWFIDGKPNNSIVYDIIYNRDLFPFCHYGDNISNIIPLDDEEWNQNTSPWKKSRICVWPTDQDDIRLCGGYKCRNGYICGSNWDKYGNKRFIDNDRDYIHEAEFYEELSYGYANFDSIVDLTMIILQSITLEGWSDLMYMFMDSDNNWLPPLWFIILIIFGNYFLLNLILAVILTKFNEARSEIRLQQQLEAKTKAEKAGEKTITRSIEIGKRGSSNNSLVKYCFRIVMSNKFQFFMVFSVLLNTVVLSLDSYPINEKVQQTSEIINFILTIVFIFEMIIKIIAFGIKFYLTDKFNVFDMLIVIISIIELSITPPSFFQSNNDIHSSGSGMSALKSFRLLRLFKLVKSWRSLQELLKMLSKSIDDVLNFFVLFLLYIYIESLVGMQFFSKEFHFDPITGFQIQIGEEGYNTSIVPRCRYDDFYYSFMTVFQHLAIDNYNLVMYDQRRSTSAWSEIYTFNLIIIGNWIVLNLFLAILLGNFSADDSNLSFERMKTSMVSAMSNILDAVSCGGCTLCRRKKKLVRVGSEVSILSGRDNILPLSQKTSFILPPVPPIVTNQNNQLQANGIVVPIMKKNTTTTIRKSLINNKSAVIKPPPNTISPPAKILKNRNKSVPHLVESFLSKKQLQESQLPQQFPNQSSVPINSNSPNCEIGSSAPPSRRSSMRYSQEENEEWKELKQVTVAAFMKKQRIEEEKSIKNDGKSKESFKRKSFISLRRSSKLSRSFSNSSYDVDDYFIKSVSVNSESDIELYGKSFFLFSPENTFRMFVCSIVQNKWFSRFILVIIFISSITLAIENPLDDPDGVLKQILHYIDIILTIFFIIEMLLKMICYGVMFNKNSYLRDAWNVLDCFVVIISIIALFPITNVKSNINSFRALRSLRALRPLRLINRNPGLKLVTNALLNSMIGVVNIFLISVLIFLVFAIIGTNYFKGLNYGCGGENFDLLTDDQQDLIVYPRNYNNLTIEEKGWFEGKYTEVTSKSVCLWMKCEWNSEFHCPENFNNILESFMSLYEMTTTEGWQSIMYIGLDGRGIDMQPVVDSNKAWCFYFIIFIVVGSFFILNLFVGIIIKNFNEMKHKLGKDHLFLTDEQREWVDLQESLLAMKIQRPLKRPKNIYRQKCFNLIRHKKFDLGIMICIIINTIFMACSHYGEPFVFSQIMDYFNVIFTIIFTLEMILKVIGLGIKQYLRDNWNIFDMLITIGSDIGLILKYSISNTNLSVLIIIRTFRIGRIFRLIQNMKSLRILFNTLVLTLPSLVNVSGILLLMLFIYTTIGVQLFAKVKPGMILNDQINFHNFGYAFLTLVRSGTGEIWNYLMYDCTVDSECVDDPPFNSNYCLNSNDVNCIELNGCGNWLSYIYFYSFSLIISSILVQLFIGVILDGFGNVSHSENAKLSPEQYEEFVRIWNEFDTDAKCSIPLSLLDDLFGQIPPPMGFEDDIIGEERRKRIAKMKIPMYKRDNGEPRIYFSDVLLACAKRIVEDDLRERGNDHFKIDLPQEHRAVKAWNRKYKKMKEITNRDIEYNIRHYYSVLQLLTAYQCYKFRRQMKIDSAIPPDL